MILDHLHNSSKYSELHPGFSPAFAWLKATNTETIEPGRYPIMGEDVFALVSEYTTKPETECRPESHRKYIDIQIMVLGKEIIGWEPLENQPLQVPYDEKADIAFYAGKPAGFELRAGCFAVFYPTDIHMPCVEAGGKQQVKKIVIKIRCS